MELQTATAAKRIGEVFPFEGVFPFARQEYCGREVSCAAPCSVKGTLSFDGSAFTVTAAVDTVLQSACALCAEPFEEPLHFELEERFSKNAPTDDESEDYPCDGDRLVLDDAITDNLFLNLPLTSVCKPDCKGLCPVCGKNRNHIDCGCAQDAPDSPWAILSSLRIDD